MCSSFSASVTEAMCSQAWLRSRKAYEAFQEKPSSGNLFRVFNDLVGDVRNWVRDDRAPIQSVFVRFEEALEHGDTRFAQSLASEAALNAGEYEDVGPVRIVLAARAILAHGNTEVADGLFADTNSRDDRFGGSLLTLFLLRIRCRVSDLKNRKLFEKIVVMKPRGYSVAVAEWMEHNWRYQGPDRQMVQWFWQLIQEKGLSDRKVLSAVTAMATRVNAWELVDAIIDVHPDLMHRFTNVLPLARHLIRTGRGTDEMQAYRDLHAHIDEQTAKLLEYFADPNVSIAVVGNSPCELGKKHGSAIDAHNEVVRFNYFELAPEYVEDYGSRFTTHGRGPGSSEELAERSVRAERAVICTYDFTYVPRDWTRWLELHRRGVQLAALPTGVHQNLQKQLLAEPSLGLAFLSWLKSIRGSLSKDSCFGFSFVDQIGSHTSAARYFGGPPPALTHRWDLESAIFQSMFV